jgi:hypothetical protein
VTPVSEEPRRWDPADPLNQIDFGRATVGDLLAFYQHKGADSYNDFFVFCHKVVVGGVLDIALDDMPLVSQAVIDKLMAHNQAVKDCVEMAIMMGKIDQFLDSGDDG